MRSAILVASFALTLLAAPVPSAQKPPRSVDNREADADADADPYVRDFDPWPKQRREAYVHPNDRREAYVHPNSRRSAESYNEVRTEKADSDLIKPIWPERRDAEAYTHGYTRREAAFTHGPERREAAFTHGPERREAEAEPIDAAEKFDEREAEPEQTKPSYGPQSDSLERREPGHTRIGHGPPKRDADPEPVNRWPGGGNRRRDAEAEAYNRMGHSRREAGGPTRLVNGD